MGMTRKNPVIPAEIVAELSPKAAAFFRDLIDRYERRIVAPEMQGVDSLTGFFQLMDQSAMSRLQQAPNDGQAEFDVALIRIEERNLDDAVKHLNRACALLPKSVTARQWRAYVLAELRRWPEALADADWVLQQIEEPDFRLLRAEWQIRNGDLLRAMEDCTHLIDNNPKLAKRAQGLRWFCQETNGEASAADADRQMFLEKMTDDDITLNLIAGPMVGTDPSLRHPVLAQLVVDHLLAIQTDFEPEVRHTIAMTLYRNDRFQDGLDALKDNLVDPSGFYCPCAAATAAMCEAKLDELRYCSE